MSQQTNIPESGSVMPKFVLVTAAYNEEALIERVIVSVIAQTHRPEKWVIVSDGSTDRTDEIVSRYAGRHGFIQLLRVTEKHARNFAAQAAAINAGFGAVADIDYEFIGNLDADLTMDPEYFAQLMEKFKADPELGLSGGSVYEEQGGVFQYRSTNNPDSVMHGVQMFRRQFFVGMGSRYPVLPYMGADWYAEVAARMNGWRVRSHADLKAYHHRPAGVAVGRLRYCHRQGLMDFTVGCHPFFEVLKCMSRMGRPPYILGGAARLFGFTQAFLQREKRRVSPEFIAYLRNEQRARLRFSKIVARYREMTTVPKI
jgi:poly-beta-1,6-N-acetyl-D-glucosamine synthase